MIIFNDLEKLKKFLQTDKEKNSFSPVRLIDIDSISTWIEMKKFLTALSEKIIFLSDFCMDEDTAPNLRKLYSELKNVNQSVCIFPLSEYLRLKPENAAEEINKILNIQSQETKKIRLYFLMYRLKSIFQLLKTDDPRKKDCLISLDTNTDDDYSLTVIQKNMPINFKNNRANGFKKYLRYWEETPNNSLCLYTDNAIYFQDKNFFDDVKIIVNAFDLLRHYYELPEGLEKNFGSNDNWQNLATLASSAGNFNKALCKEFSTDKFQIKLFENWSEQNNFRHWLLWIWCKTQISNSYPAHCARKSNSIEDFEEKIFLSIFDFVEQKNFDEIYNERKEILFLMKIPVPKNFSEKIRQADKKIALKILTDNSTQEKILIFQTLQRFKFSESNKVLKILQKVYSELANYLSNSADLQTDEEHEKYFRQYRWLKVTNNLTKDFFERVQEISEQKGKDIYNLPSRNQIVENEYSDSAAIFFVDSMGVEYLNYFFKKFSSLDEKFSIRYKIGYCNLPSVTKINKDFLQEKNIAEEILELDKMKHSNFDYPENIINELNFLATLKEKILSALDKFQKIILCSDHGSSRLAVIARKNFDKTFSTDGRIIYNCGRYAKTLPNEEKIFSSAIYGGEKIIFADYSRFSQTGSPGNEIHGGASWEEWLVPVIIIEKLEKNSARQQIKISSPEKKFGIKENKNFDI